MKRQQPTFSEVNLSEHDGVRYLHLGTEWVQGSMRIDAPFEIDLEYVQRMMAWLLFVPEDSVAGRHAMQLGLGAGAITKFCYKKLRMTCTAVELNPRVADVCRAWLRSPTPPKKSAATSGWARSTRWRSICTTTRPPRRCWIRPLSMPTAGAC